MKYLKKFIINEAVNKVEVQEFCNNNLAYLIDKGFYFAITSYSYKYIISIKKTSHELFQWSDVKDDLIPFLIFFNIPGYISIDIKSKFDFYIQDINVDNLDNIGISYPIRSIGFSILSKNW